MTLDSHFMFYSCKFPSLPLKMAMVVQRGWQRCCKWSEGMIIERVGSGGEHGRIWYSYLALTLEYFVGGGMRDQELFLTNSRLPLF